MSHHSCRARVLVVLFSTFLSASAHAGLFEITNRTYGSAPASARASIDQLFDSLENSVNSSLPDADQSTYLRGIANSSVMSAAGVGVDYASQFGLFELGVSGGLGADLGGPGIFDLLSGDANADRVSGFAGQYSIVAGFRPTFLAQGKWKNIDLNRVRMYLHFMSSSYTRDDVEMDFSSWGLTFQYKIIPERSVGAGTARWNGLDLTSGLRYSSMNGLIRKTITQSSTGTVDAPGNPSVTTEFNGILNVGADSSNYSIPLEASTSARLLYVLTPYVGLGADIAFGGTTSVATVNGPVTVTDSSGTLGNISGSAALDLGQDSGPQLVNLRYFVGTQLELGVVGIFVQLNQALTNDTTGVSAGLRAFW